MSKIVASSAQKLIATFEQSINARFDAARIEENDAKMNHFEKLKTRFITKGFADSLIKSEIEYDVMKAVFVKIANPNEKDSANFIAQKAINKICTAIEFIAGTGKLDRYSESMIANALINDGKVSAIGALRSLCKSIIDEDGEAGLTVEKIKYCAKVKAGTAGTQRSSTRQCFIELKLCNCTKNKKDDPFELNESGIAVLNKLLK